jgi:sugar phosphate isomerase/epimerase
MTRPVTLFTGQWADLKLEDLCKHAAEFGYDGLELACWGDHFDVQRALKEDDYCAGRWQILESAGLGCYAISNHLVGQAVCDCIDERHRSIVPEHVWGDGEPEGVRSRAANEMMDSARAARRFFDCAPPRIKERLHRVVVNGFTGSSVWPLLYSFPPNLPNQIDQGYEDFARRWKPILDVFEEQNVDFALEVHPTEIAFDIRTAARALHALDGHNRFCFNFDPSHLGYQGVDYILFLRSFAQRIAHVHIKDVYWADTPGRSASLAAMPTSAMRIASGTSARRVAATSTSRRSSACSTTSGTRGRSPSSGRTQ